VCSSDLYPTSEPELIAAVVGSKGPIRCFGGGHSFTPLVPTAGTLISLEALSRLIDHDPATSRATFAAGTRVMMAGDLLAGVDQSLQNQPDINLQSLAGAISTATHGTGCTLQCLSAYVTQLKLVLADGSVVVCSNDQDAELFQAARVAFGTCGVISELTLQNRPAYRLAEHSYPLDLEPALQRIEQQRDKDRHIELFVFPYGDKAVVKQLNITNAAATPTPEPGIDQNWALQKCADLTHSWPSTKGALQRLVGAVVDDERRVDEAHRVFASTRSVPFNEMEYSVPAEQGIECLQEIMHVMRTQDLPVFFPIEFRYVAADDIWLSPFYQRPSASISVHQYTADDYRPFFAAVEPVFHKHKGRPHWGKLHTLTAKQLRPLYPQWDAFAAARMRVDPRGRFMNNYVRSLLGVG
jgi:FAD-linked oxidoreductase